MADELVPQGPRGISFDGAAFIPNASAPRFLWGDERAGYVSDWIYGSSAKVHMMSFEMNVGARFGNSPDFKTYYNAAETYHCLKGQFTFHCPETGALLPAENLALGLQFRPRDVSRARKPDAPHRGGGRGLRRQAALARAHPAWPQRPHRPLRARRCARA